MMKGIWPAAPFGRAVVIFFAVVLLALGIATFVNAPLSFYGSFALFRVLDGHRFFASRGRSIDVALQVPVLIATRFTDNLAVLRSIFCASYAAIPLLGLAVSWLVCRSRRPSLFIWPAMSICIIGLPGQFSFASEALMAVTLLWPALLAVLVGAPATILTLVAITSIAAVCAHPNAAAVLAFIVLVAIVSAIVRPQSRNRSLLFALALGALQLLRTLMPLDHYERHLIGFPTLLMSFNDSVLGWPLTAIALTMVAALSCLLPLRSHARILFAAPLILAGVALVAWAGHPAGWTKFDDYRFWDPAFSMLLMAGAAIEELWLRRAPERDLQAVRLYALPLIGSIFLGVFSTMSLVWTMASRRLANDLANSDRGCISFKNVASVRDTALDQWSLGFYALELQDRTPKTLLLKHNFTCRLFALSGDAILAENPATIYIKHPGEGWFNFEDARSRARAAGKVRATPRKDDR